MDTRFPLASSKWTEFKTVVFSILLVLCIALMVICMQISNLWLKIKVKYRINMGGFFKWAYPKKPTGFFGYVPGCPNPGQKRLRKNHLVVIYPKSQVKKPLNKSTENKVHPWYMGMKYAISHSLFTISHRLLPLNFIMHARLKWNP